MRILQFIDVPWDSGLAHYALTLSQELKRRGHVLFISAVPGEKPWKKAQQLGLKTVPLTSLKGLNALRRFIKEHNIELLNAHTGSTHSLSVAAALGQKVAVVRTRSDARTVRARVGSSFLYRHTQRVVAAADYIRQSFLDTLKLPPQKVVTIYQGIDTGIFAVQPLPPGPVLGIVARLDPVKGHRYLLESLSLLKGMYPKLKLKIVGQEENVKLRQLHDETQRLRLDGMVDFAGYHKNIPAVMASCSIGVIASTGSEAVSRAALEWMSCGRAVVSTRVGCLAEMIVDGESGYLVAPKDAAAIARALGALLHDPSRVEKMSAAARTRAENLFSLKVFGDRTEEVYREALQAVR